MSLVSYYLRSPDNLYEYNCRLLIGNYKPVESDDPVWIVEKSK